MIGTAHQRARFHVREPHSQAGAAQFGELPRSRVAHNGKVLRRRPQVLTQGQDITVQRVALYDALLQLGEQLLEQGELIKDLATAKDYESTD